MISNFILVGIGGATGAILRYGLSQLPIGAPLPYATLCTNVIGCLLIGVLMALLQQHKITQASYLLLATGLCGGFTTFSTFSMENIQYLLTGNIAKFALYILITVVCCLAATFIGYKIVYNNITT